MGARCAPQPPPTDAKPAEISRDRAIEIARREIRFTVDTVDAIQVKSEAPGNPIVWRVTIKGRLPDQLPGLFETRIFEIDVKTGEIRGAAMN